jgi:hypothetical protein
MGEPERVPDGAKVSNGNMIGDSGEIKGVALWLT